MSDALPELKLIESNGSIYGTPVDFTREYAFRGRSLYAYGAVYGPYVPERKPDKTILVRNSADLDYWRNRADTLLETDPGAAGLLRGLINYTLGRGCQLKVQGAGTAEAPVRLAKTVTAFCKRWALVNDWAVMQRECLERLHRQGELFLRFYPDEDAVTKVEFVEPGDVRPPYGEGDDGPWSFGLYAPYRTSEVEIYNIRHWADSTDEQVEPQFIVHHKLNTRKNQKRGLSTFLASEDELTGATRLRWATREGEKVRASIAYMRQHATADQSAAQAMQQGLSTDTVNVTTPYGGQDTVSLQDIYPGSVQDISPGLEYKPPPGSPNSEAAATAVRKSLEAAAGRFNVPYWLVSGDSTASSYAASLTAESPFVKELECQQALCEFVFLQILWKIIEIGVEQGELPEDVREKVDLALEFPSAVVRNEKDSTERNEKLHNNRVLSLATWTAREDLDYDREQANLSEEAPAGLVVGERAVPTPPGAPETASGQMQRDQGGEAR